MRHLLWSASGVNENSVEILRTWSAAASVNCQPVCHLTFMTPKQSHPKVNWLTAWPMPPSPKSKACLRWKGALGSAYGTVCVCIM